MIHAVGNWLYYFFGLESADNSHYLFWSGIGIGILTVLALVGSIFRVGWSVKKRLDRHHKQIQRHIDYKLGQLDTEATDASTS